MTVQDADFEALKREVQSQRDIINRLLKNGLEVALTQNLLGTASAATDGTSKLSARKDHSH